MSDRHDLARHAFGVMRQYLRGRLDPSAYREALLLLDDRYPGCGFAALAAEVTALPPVPPDEEPPPTP
jgi:hypothetical protein